MDNYQFLLTYISLQKDIMFDEFIDTEFAKICISNSDPSFFWNNALVNSQLQEKELREIEEVLLSFKRTPAVYFENRPSLNNLKSQLLSNGYVSKAEDSFMFHQGNAIDQSRFDSIRKVADENSLTEFLETFNQSYKKDDPLNPYGELGDYLSAAKITWRKHHPSNRLEYFIVYKNETPVAVSSLTNFDGIGYISNVGSLMDVRGEGFGKLATMYCVSQSIKHGNTTHCLITEEGTNPNEFYKVIGFETKFTANILVKE